MTPTRNFGLKSSKATQSQRKLRAKFEQLDIAKRNAAMNSSKENLLREEEEQRKCLRLPIGTESDLEQIASGQPAQTQTQEKVETTQSPLNMSMEAITDGDSSELFLLTDLIPPTRVNPKRTQDPSAHKSTDIKQDKLRKVD